MAVSIVFRTPHGWLGVFPNRGDKSAATGAKNAPDRAFLAWTKYRTIKNTKKIISCQRLTLLDYPTKTSVCWNSRPSQPTPNWLNSSKQPHEKKPGNFLPSHPRFVDRPGVWTGLVESDTYVIPLWVGGPCQLCDLRSNFFRPKKAILSLNFAKSTCNLPKFSHTAPGHRGAQKKSARPN